MQEIAGWIAPAATMIAAMMTAANLGARLTGWGFVVFTVGSICWSYIGATQGPPGLLYSNLFLSAVNLVGIWRWLGRQVKYEAGGEAAVRKSARLPRAPTLFAASRLAGAVVEDERGERIGTVVDAMLGCDTNAVSYLVVSRGGVGGVGETLHALPPRQLLFRGDRVVSRLDGTAIDALPALDAERWPAVPPGH